LRASTGPYTVTLRSDVIVVIVPFDADVVLDFPARRRSAMSGLSARTVLEHDGVQITDVACRQPPGRGHREEAGHHAVVLVRRGCFVRGADGADHVLDPTRAYCINPGQEQRYDHPHHHGDDCTSVRLDASLLASLWGGDPTLPTAPLPSPPWIDVEHRLLLTAARRGTTRHELFERTISLTGALLAQANSRRVASGRPASARARKLLVDAVREAMAADPATSLPDLAATLGVSSYHLSRTFRAATGHTIARHRMRLRVRSALERLAAGEHDLARLAAEIGFVDQSHLCRVIRSETGQVPSALRRALG
jgi:AraC-like DNA-binding protein